MFDRRPTLVLGAGLVIGLTCLLHLANLVFVPLVLAALLRSGTRWLFAFGLGLGLLLAPKEIHTIFDRDFVNVTGQVSSLPRVSDYGTSFNLTARDTVWRIESKSKLAVELGTQLRVKGLALPLKEGSEAFMLVHGITGRLQAQQVEMVATAPAAWRLANAWRRSFRQFCQRALPSEEAAFTEALCFDMSAGIDQTMTDRLRSTGTLHLLTASGLHVVVLGGVLFYVFSFLPVPKIFKLLLVAIVLLLYCGATGLTPAVVRASMMFVVGMSAYLFRRERDGLSALGLVASLYLLWQPREIYDPGFQISLIAVGGILLFSPREHRFDGKQSVFVLRLKDAASLAWIAFLVTTPLTAFYFGYVSLTALPTNLVLGLVASVAASFAFMGYFLYLLIPSIGAGLAVVVTGPCVGVILWMLDKVSSPAPLDVPAFSAYWLPVIYGLLLLTWRQRIVQP